MKNRFLFLHFKQIYFIIINYKGLNFNIFATNFFRTLGMDLSKLCDFNKQFFHWEFHWFYSSRTFLNHFFGIFFQYLSNFLIFFSRNMGIKFNFNNNQKDRLQLCEVVITINIMTHKIINDPLNSIQSIRNSNDSTRKYCCTNCFI